MPRITVVIPMQNEAGNVVPVLEEVARALEDGPAWEIVAVDDGSTDATFDELHRARAGLRNVRVLRHARPAGKSAAIHNAVLAARAGIVCTMDGDGQNPAFEIARLCAPLLAGPGGRLGLVAGQRRRRRDRPAKRLASRLANALRSWLLADGTRDTACGLKAFRRDAFLGLPYFDNMHRYLPALFRRDGWGVAHIEVEDRARLSGRSKYTNAGRALVGAWDLIGVAWLIRRRRRSDASEVPRAERAEAAE
jgi:dolichol-phosphate mannosyltransferase